MRKTVAFIVACVAAAEFLVLLADLCFFENPAHAALLFFTTGVGILAAEIHKDLCSK